jgi:low temperature requirement protein LtrA
VAIVAERRLAEAPVGKEQNEMARDSYSLLHFPMVAGVILIALGIEKTIAHVDEPLSQVGAFALVGGLAVYLLAHVAFRFRNVRSISRQRLALAVVLLAAVPIADGPDALVALAAVAAAMVGLIAYESTHFAAGRDDVRHGGAR